MAQPIAQAPRLPEPVQASAEIRAAAEEFEALFLSELLAPIFDQLSTDGIGGGGAGERAYRPLLVQEYAKAIAASGGIGVADAVTRELVRLQEGQADG